MKIKILLFLFCAVLVSGCRVCDHFYSEDKESFFIQRDLFDLWLQIIGSDLEISMYSKKSSGELIYQPTDNSGAIKRATIKYFPVLSGTTDTLEANPQGQHGLGHYDFLYSRPWAEEIDLTVLFDMDSSGVVVSKRVEFKNLRLKKECDFRFPRLAH